MGYLAITRLVLFDPCVLLERNKAETHATLMLLPFQATASEHS
jgi:hypothetical protein